MPLQLLHLRPKMLQKQKTRILHQLPSKRSQWMEEPKEADKAWAPPRWKIIAKAPLRDKTRHLKPIWVLKILRHRVCQSWLLMYHMPNCNNSRTSIAYRLLRKWIKDQLSVLLANIRIVIYLPQGIHLLRINSLVWGWPQTPLTSLLTIRWQSLRKKRAEGRAKWTTKPEHLGICSRCRSQMQTQIKESLKHHYLKEGKLIPCDLRIPDSCKTFLSRRINFRKPNCWKQRLYNKIKRFEKLALKAN